LLVTILNYIYHLIIMGGAKIMSIPKLEIIRFCFAMP